MTTLLKDQPMVQRAYEKYKQFNQDERLRALDESRERFLHDLATDREEAEIRKATDIARNMKNKGYDVAFITEMTGLPIAKIERLD